MQTGPYVADRLMPKVIAAYCAHAGIGFQAFSDEWVLRLSRGVITKWIVGYKFDLNQSAASELAQDKVATYAALQASGIEAIPHYLVRSLPHELIHIRTLRQILNGLPVVAKPLEGTSGREVERFNTVDDALAMIRTSGDPAWAVSPYCDLQAEYRLVMLDGLLLLAYGKTQPTIRRELKLFNLGLGAVAVEVSDTQLLKSLLTIAERAVQATTLRLAAVDIVRLANGSLQVLEVNDGISMEHYARQSNKNSARAKTVYEAIIAAMFP